MGVVSLESEIENKYELFDGSIDNVVQRVSDALVRLKSNGWEFANMPEESERHVNYYDTFRRNKNKRYVPTFEVYRNGQTIREVSGYSDHSYRYDYKKGRLKKRKEANLESNHRLGAKEILYNVPDELQEKWNCKVRDKIKLKCTASAEVKHIKWNLEKNGTKIELKLDFFDIYKGSHLRELELEIKHNGKSGKKYLKAVSAYLQDNLGLKRVYDQKYTTIMNSSPKYYKSLPRQG